MYNPMITIEGNVPDEGEGSAAAGLWEEFVLRVQTIAREHRYAEIGIEVQDHGLLE